MGVFIHLSIYLLGKSFPVVNKKQEWGGGGYTSVVKARGSAQTLFALTRRHAWPSKQDCRRYAEQRSRQRASFPR